MKFVNEFASRRKRGAVDIPLYITLITPAVYLFAWCARVIINYSTCARCWSAYRRAATINRARRTRHFCNRQPAGRFSPPQPREDRSSPRMRRTRCTDRVEFVYFLGFGHLIIRCQVMSVLLLFPLRRAERWDFAKTNLICTFLKLLSSELSPASLFPSSHLF